MILFAFVVSVKSCFGFSRSSEYVSLLFDIPQGRKLPIYVYEHGLIGLMANYWVIYRVDYYNNLESIIISCSR